MMNTNKKTPKLRFKGFTDDWEQRKFKDIAFKRGKISEADLPYVEFEDINSGIGTLNKNISQKVGHKKGLLFEAGDVLFGKLRPYLQNWLLCQFAGIAVGDFWVLQPQNVSSAFLYYLIQSEAYQSVANISSGTKMPRSSWPLVSETLFSIPKYKEANMIGEFFLLIDRTITLHQRKLEKLKLNKSALLQKLFPQKGCTIPDVRFKGFTDAWEQRKLGDVAIITGGGTPSTNVPEYWNGDIDWYSPVEIGKNRYVSKSTRKITKLGLEKSSAKLLPIGTVLFTSRAGIGNTAILQAEGCTNQGFQSITPDSKELDTYFLYTMTPRLKRYGEVTGAGSTFVEVSGKQMEKMSLVLPSLEEQKQIGRFFRTIDDSITLHQRKLDCLISIKKGLLQQLFV